MARGDVKRAVIRWIADTRRVSLGVAAHIYACASIARRKRWCEQLEAQQRAAGDAPHV